ncbi:hypothetical protein P154DRAFT_378910, partial [Amniculicola lignicola CBS 123094]
SAPDASISHTASLQYWNSVSADTNGMLGGYPQTSRIDLQGSSNFLAKLRRRHHASRSTPTHTPTNTNTNTNTAASPAASTKQAAVFPLLDRAADCGAGIGRITKGFLMGVARTVDVIEPVEKFTAELVREVEGVNDGGASRAKIGEVINLGLQDWTPERGGYNLIWNQWCLGHLTDVQLVGYLERCREGLAGAEAEEGEDGEGGGGGGGREAWIVVKENMSTDIWGKDIFDEEDSSVTRSDAKFRGLFKEAGLKVVAEEVQRGFPKELYPVRMYALRPE